MKFSLAAGVILQLATSHTVLAFTSSSSTNIRNTFFAKQHGPAKAPSSFSLSVVPPKGGINFEEEKENVEDSLDSSSNNTDSQSSAAAVAVLTADTATATSSSVQTETPPPTFTSKRSASVLRRSQFRGKMNEIDFCMSPADVSLSRLYQSSTSFTSQSQPTSVASTAAALNNDNSKSVNVKGDSDTPRIMSLTRALNNASNRAVRRILLSRSWPSAEALNISLRQVLASGGGSAGTQKTNANSSEAKKALSSVTETEKVSSKDRSISLNVADIVEEKESSAKCPIPRPILNIIVKESEKNNSKSRSLDSSVSVADSPITDGQAPEITSPTPLSRKGTTEQQWVKDQLEAFQETYGDLEGYKYAEAYMDCILSLATSGVESNRVKEVMEQGVYEDAYRRILTVLKSAGVAFEGVKDEDGSSERSGKMKIAPKLRDQDICLSILDKINIQNGSEGKVAVTITKLKKEDDQMEVLQQVEEDEVEEAAEEIKERGDIVLEEKVTDNEKDADKSEGKKKRDGLAGKLLYWMTPKENEPEDETSRAFELNMEDLNGKEEEQLVKKEAVVEVDEEVIKPEDLGGVLLSKEEPTITRQLNILSNIVKRTLLFGGDQEILVLSKTLEADRPAFIQQRYPGISDIGGMKSNQAPGLQFFDCLVQLLKDCYTNGIVTSLDPPLPLTPSYANSYERLTALLAELGSGYVKPTADSKILTKKPQTPKEEFIRFSQWEVALRQTQPDVSDFPSDLVGSWQVKDEVGGKVIGTSTVVFKPEGEVVVSPPLKGLKWRLDPGPTHLDTCTFQVLSEDGAILQYRGFLDRGARLESRFSKRSIKIRGAVAFQMRDSDASLIGDDYKRDLLPIDTRSGTTRFVMSKVFDLSNN